MREDVIMGLQQMGYLSDNEHLMAEDLYQAMYALICDHKRLISIHNVIKDSVNQALEGYYEN